MQRNSPAKSSSSSIDPLLEQVSAAADSAPLDRRRRWTPFYAAAVSAAALWASLPPLGWWPLAIGAAFPMAWWISVPALPGRRPYVQAFVAFWLGNLAIYQFLRLAHGGAAIGWVILAAYLAWPPVASLAISRRLVHGFGWSPWWVAPIVWSCLEWVRSNLFTGFAMGLVGHAVFRLPTLTQVVDLGGVYLLSGLILLWGFGIATLAGIGGESSRRRKISAGLATLLSVVATLGYSATRLAAPSGDLSARIGVVQGNVEAFFPTTETEANDYWEGIERDYREGTRRLVQQEPALDLIVWPESKFTAPDVLATDEPLAEAERQRWESRQIDLEATALVAQGAWEIDELADALRSAPELQGSPLERFRSFVASKEFPFVPMLVGVSTTDHRFDQFYNAAIYLNSERQVTHRYYKNHLVMFGEYVPLGEVFPWIYKIMPFDGKLKAGTQGVAVPAGSLHLLPSVCFESTVPHLLRRQIRELEQAGTPVQALVNVTDDSWFHGASGLDLHLACNVMRAVEQRMPMVVAANGGISAIIDGRGRMVVEATRSQRTELAATIWSEQIASPYRQFGDLPWWILTGGVIFATLMALLRRPQ